MLPCYAQLCRRSFLPTHSISPSTHKREHVPLSASRRSPWGCLGADIDVPLLQPHGLLGCASTVQWRVVVQREVDKLYRSMLEMQQSKVSVRRMWAKTPFLIHGVTPDSQPCTLILTQPPTPRYE